MGLNPLIINERIKLNTQNRTSNRRYSPSSKILNNRPSINRDNHLIKMAVILHKRTSFALNINHFRDICYFMTRYGIYNRISAKIIAL